MLRCTLAVKGDAVSCPAGAWNNISKINIGQNPKFGQLSSKTANRCRV